MNSAFAPGNLTWLRRALPALAILLAVAAPLGALPAAGAYPSEKTALRAANDAERELLAMINADRALRGEGPLGWDGLISAVAREHSQDMAENDYFEYVSPRIGTIEYRLHRAGVSTPSARYAIFRASSLDTLVTELKRGHVPFHMQPATHLGLGVFSKGLLPKVLFVTLISREKRTILEPFPTLPVYGKTYWLAGAVEQGLTAPTLIVTLPNGEVKERALELSSKGEFKTKVRFTNGRGKYSIEIVAKGALGPTVLDLMHCYAGVEGYPAPPSRETSVPTPSDLQQAERLMFEMINRARGQARLSRLDYDERLAKVARGHSEDMERNRFFAHISPTRGDLAQRMERAGIKAKAFTENLSANRDLGAAHRGLMDSPGHRRNILDPNATHVGVGVVRGDGDRLVMTQNFSSEFPTYNTASLADDFREAVNDARADARLRRLKSNDALARIALENSRWMREHGRLGYDRAKALLDEEKLRYKFIRMNVFQSTNPPTPEQIEETLNKRYRDVGIGIVQSASESGEKWLWTTVLLGEK